MCTKRVTVVIEDQLFHNDSNAVEDVPRCAAALATAMGCGFYAAVGL